MSATHSQMGCNALHMHTQAENNKENMVKR